LKTSFLQVQKMVLIKFADNKSKAARIRLIKARQMGTLIICAATFNIILRRKLNENKGKTDCDNYRYITKILKIKN
jgi:hypothetical protein